jgi:hypothetical protein
MMATNPPISNTAVPGTDIHDIRPPLEILGWERFWWVPVVMLATGLLAWLVVYLLNRKKNILPPPLPPAHVRARQKLEAALDLITQPKPFCILVSDTVRQYLEERFNFHAPDRTTEEFLHELRKSQLLTSGQKESLSGFLQQCDLVKFAKYEPGEPELRELHGSALRLVDETKPLSEGMIPPLPSTQSVPQPEPVAEAKP